MRSVFFTTAAAAALLAAPAYASGSGHHHHHASSAKDHAPIGVMGDHMHKKGEFMLSYRFMRMDMNDTRIGTDRIGPLAVATTEPNPFFGAPMQPPTLRVVPLDMTMDMHMLGAMYAPTDWLTLMVMGSVVDKEMDHRTFMGPAGGAVLGEFRTRAFGIGDTTVAGLVRIFDAKTGGISHHAHANIGVSAPTGSIGETDDVLAPTGMTPTLRLPYPMQLGSGTWDAKPGVTYTGSSDDFSWGAQYAATLPLNDNDAGYSFGDKHQVTAWGAYGLSDWVSVSARALFTAQNAIDGADANIVAPVQTANPDNHGGDRLDLGGGMNLLVQSGPLKGHRFAIEALFPVHQDLNGPQLETDWTLTVGWQTAF